MIVEVTFRPFLKAKASLLRPRPIHRPWKSSSGTQSKNSILASEYEAYLEQYPEGGFVALARVRLEAIKQDAVSMRDPHDREIELSFWESVRGSDNPALVQAYLEKYPSGEFSALARIRVDELTPDSHTA